jgi:hypothetical protein
MSTEAFTLIAEGIICVVRIIRPCISNTSTEGRLARLPVTLKVMFPAVGFGNTVLQPHDGPDSPMAKLLSCPDNQPARPKMNLSYLTFSPLHRLGWLALGHPQPIPEGPFNDCSPIA